ncbi:MaoC family dehydratase [Vreelandella titanicae]|nr:MaoC family dehydratase [Halomonas titanicae]
MSQFLQTVSLEVNEHVIRAYAELSEDYNPIHLDPAFAATTSMGGVIAHGTMSISLIWQSLSRTFGASIFESLKLDVRFLKPVRLGETIVAGGRINTDNPELTEVWVRGDDGSDCIVGTVQLAATNYINEQEHPYANF